MTHPHSTHHDDCGCKSSRYELRLSALRHALRTIRTLTPLKFAEIYATADSALDADEKEANP